MIERCPSCASRDLDVFYEVAGVPVNSVLSLPSREEARGFPLGNIVLAFCDTCGFIFNRAFEPERLEYSQRYEETQSFSPTFRRWHRKLAARLVERYDLRGKTIVEIGCGKGEFLTLLCELGDNRGIGFDPAYVPERQMRTQSRVEFVRDFYSDAYVSRRCDFLCCKMTLEHVAESAAFVDQVRRAVRDDPSIVVFFQVPDVWRILEEGAFWDIYYEHCSYFSGGSLARLFERSGFEIVEITREYGAQYLTLEARARGKSNAHGKTAPDDREEVRALVESFRSHGRARISEWRTSLERWRDAGRRVVVWGSGSKGVSFLTSLAVDRAVEHVVDINPNRQGCFMPGTAQAIVGPDFLSAYRPDVVIVANPVYRGEIEVALCERGLSCEVVAL